MVFKSLRRSWTWSLGVSSLLAVGLGACVALSSLVFGVLLRPLPYPEPGRLVQISEYVEETPDQSLAVSYLNARDWETSSQTLEAMSLLRSGSVVLTHEDGAERLTANFVSATYFEMFGAHTALGRVFDATAADPGTRQSEVVLSHSLWERSFGGDRSVLGRTIQLGGVPFVVVGVLEQGFRAAFTARPDQVSLFLPLGAAATFQDPGSAIFEQRRFRWFTAVGRLAEGVSFSSAQDELLGLGRALSTSYPDTNRGFSVRAVELRESLTGEIRAPVLVLMAGAAILLLIACFNTTNLFLVRSSTRGGELAVHAALGARRASLLRRMTMEAVVLSAAGGVGALALTWMTLPSLVGLSPNALINEESATISVPVLSGAVFLSLLVGVVCGLIPAVRATRASALGILTRGGRTVDTGLRRVQGLVAGASVAIAMVLLTVGVHIALGFSSLRNSDPGFVSDRVMTARVDLPASEYPDAEALARFAATLKESVELDSEVEWAHVWAPGRPGETNWVQSTVPEGAAVERMSDATLSRFHMVTPGAISAMGLRMTTGRALANADDGGVPRVAVINEALAEHLWPGESPIGKRFRRFQPPGTENPDNAWCEVVGVVADAPLGGRLAEPWADDLTFDIFYPYAQRPRASVSLLVRGRTSADATVAGLRQTLHDLDPDLALYAVTAMDDHLAAEEGTLRFASTLTTVFGAVAMALATLAVSAVLAYTVSIRTKEVGVRAALGATASDTLSLFLRQSLAMASLGVALGAVLSLGVLRVVSGFLVGVSTPSFSSVAGPALLLLVAVGLATWSPLRRALRISPVSALQGE